MEEKRAAKYYFVLPLFYDDMSETSHHKKPCDFLRSHGQSKYMSALIQLIIATLKNIAVYLFINEPYDPLFSI